MIVDSVQGRAVDLQRRTPVAVQAFDTGPHHGKRFYNAFHRAFLYGRIAGKSRGKRLGGKDTGNKPGSGAAIAGIECAGGSGQAVQSFAPYGNSILLVFDIDAQAAETADGGQAVRALEKIGNFGFPFGQSAEHDRAVRDGFIAGNGNFPFQAFDVVEFHG